ncbi:hypothetical protein PMIN03_002285 [Paraphaeosphaeria minitans]
MDAGLFLEQNDGMSTILRDIRIYVGMGGTLILTPGIGFLEGNPAVDNLLKDLGRSWKIGPMEQLGDWDDSQLEAMLVRLRSRKCSMYKEWMLPASVALVGENDAETPEDTRTGSPVIWERSAGGWFGFVRDCKRREDGWMIIAAMCGLEIGR